jgi:hypothetical protein
VWLLFSTSIITLYSTEFSVQNAITLLHYPLFFNNRFKLCNCFFYRIQIIPILHACAISVWVSYVRYPELYRMSCIHIIRFHTGLATLVNLSHFYRSHYLSSVPLIYIRVPCPHYICIRIHT